MLKNKTELFAAPDDSLAIDEAKTYIKQMKFTVNDVRIVKRNDQIIVEAIRDID